MKKKKEKVLEIFDDFIDEDIKLICTGKNKIVVQNYLGILEYEVECIRLNSKSGDVYIYGRDLIITEITLDDMLITGEINIIEYER